jgi:hypothetical protein
VAAAGLPGTEPTTRAQPIGGAPPELDDHKEA